MAGNWFSWITFKGRALWSLCTGIRSSSRLAQCQIYFLFSVWTSSSLSTVFQRSPSSKLHITTPDPSLTDLSIQNGSGYPCFCSKERLQSLRLKRQHTGYDGLCRSLSRKQAEEKMSAGTPYTIRLKVSLPLYSVNLYGCMCHIRCHMIW